MDNIVANQNLNSVLSESPEFLPCKDECYPASVGCFITWGAEVLKIKSTDWFAIGPCYASADGNLFIALGLYFEGDVEWWHGEGHAGQVILGEHSHKGHLTLGDIGIVAESSGENSHHNLPD